MTPPVQPNKKSYQTQSSMNYWYPYTTLAREPPGTSTPWSSVAPGATHWSTRGTAATVASWDLGTLLMELTGIETHHDHPGDVVDVEVLQDARLVLHHHHLHDPAVQPALLRPLQVEV